MNRKQAIQHTRKVAKARNEIIYVVCEDGEYDAATENEMENFWLAAPVVCAVSPDGYAEAV